MDQLTAYKINRRRLMAGAALLVSAGEFGSFGAMAAPLHGPPVVSEEDRLLQAEADKAWGDILASDQQARDALGLSVVDILFISESEFKRRVDFARQRMQVLGGIDPAKLSESWRCTHDWMVQIYGVQTKMAPFYWHDFVIAPYRIYRPLQSFHEAARAFEIKDDRSAEAYLQVVAKYGAFMQAHAGKVREQERRGLLMPRPVVTQVEAMVRTLKTDLRSNLDASEERAANVPAARRSSYSARLSRLLGDIGDQLETLASYLEGAYSAGAPDAISVRQYPDGEAYYRLMAQSFTTTPMDPATVHAHGLQLVDRLVGRLSALAEKAGSPSFLEFIRSRRKEPRFAVRTAADVIATDQRLLDAIRPKLPDYFNRGPRAPYRSSPLPASLKSLTFGYYDPPAATKPSGTYFFPAFNMATASMFGRRHLMYHELMPGHHMQMALALENEDLHPLHRYLWNYAFAEGWADYAANLSAEMGLDDADDEIANLANELMKAVRLVVDTGIGHYGWTLEMATVYMAKYLLLGEAEIHTEALRYATRPGQALAYRLGSDLIADLRRRSQTALGARFDIREYHDVVLAFGALPLTALDARVDRYIARVEAGQAA
jgi:uncharacterized protein (DUF885 family)